MANHYVLREEYEKEMSQVKAAQANQKKLEMVEEALNCLKTSHNSLSTELQAFQTKTIVFESDLQNNLNTYKNDMQKSMSDLFERVDIHTDNTKSVLTHLNQNIHEICESFDDVREQQALMWFKVIFASLGIATWSALITATWTYFLLK